MKLNGHGRLTAIIVFCFICGVFAGVCRSESRSTPDTFTRTLYLVRHGAYDADRKVDSDAGPGLTALGIAQARLLAARLGGLRGHFEVITSSTMTRAIDTAAVVHETLSEVPVRKSSGLRECTPPTYGKVDGDSEAEQRICARRLDEAFRQYFVPSQGAEQRDLLICHGNVIRYFVAKALGVDTRTWPLVTVAHASITVIQITPLGTFRVLSVGDVGHLPPNMQSWGDATDPNLAVPAMPKDPPGGN
jgi:serine/threonine-protein phosphatase PGAM5